MILFFYNFKENRKYNNVSAKDYLARIRYYIQWIILLTNQPDVKIENARTSGWNPEKESLNMVKHKEDIKNICANIVIEH